MRFEFRFESLKSISVLIFFVYKLMIGSFKINRENYPRKHGLSANQPSNNWALIYNPCTSIFSLYREVQTMQQDMGLARAVTKN